MTLEYCIFAVLLCISGGLNGVLVFRLRKARRTPKYDLSAQDLLHDLTRRGVSILRVEVIDPAGLMLRSPRG